MPSKTPSILFGAAVSVALGLAGALLVSRLSLSGQMAVGTATCLLAFAGPFLAVRHYVRASGQPMAVGPGAGLGAVTGVVGGLLTAALQQLLVALDVLPDAAEAIAAQREQLVAAGMPPEQIAEILRIAEASATAATPFLSVALNGVTGLLVGALGGALAAALVKGTRREA